MGQSCTCRYGKTLFWLQFRGSTPKPEVEGVEVEHCSCRYYLALEPPVSAVFLPMCLLQMVYFCPQHHLCTNTLTKSPCPCCCCVGSWCGGGCCVACGGVPDAPPGSNLWCQPFITAHHQHHQDPAAAGRQVQHAGRCL